MIVNRKISASRRHRLSVSAVMAVLLFSAPTARAGDTVMAFAVAGDRIDVASGEVIRAEIVDRQGLRFCLASDVEAALSEFTARHVGDVVTVTIDGETVFQPKIGSPFNGGCITWPVNATLAEGYRDHLLGKK